MMVWFLQIVSALAARVTSRQRSWGVCSLGTCVYCVHPVYQYTDSDCSLRNRTSHVKLLLLVSLQWSGGFDITSICCHGRVLCGRMKELVVPWWRCTHLSVLNLTADSTSVGGKGGGRYRSMRPHCLRLRMLRGQRRTHIGMESSSLFSLNLLTNVYLVLSRCHQKCPRIRIFNCKTYNCTLPIRKIFKLPVKKNNIFPGWESKKTLVKSYK